MEATCMSRFFFQIKFVDTVDAQPTPLKKNLFICCSRVEINEFGSLGFSQDLIRQYIKSLELCFSKRYKDQPMIFVIIAEPSAYE